MDVEDDNLKINESEEEDLAEEDKDGSVFECLMCLIEFPHAAALGMHYKLVHGRKEGKKMSFQCPKCPKRYISQRQASLKTHWLSAHLDYHRFQCPKCSKGFHRRDHLKRHIKFVHKTRQQKEEDSKSESLPSDAEKDDDGKAQPPFFTGQCSQNRPSLSLNNNRTPFSSVPCSLTMDINVEDDDMRINESEEEKKDDESKDGAVYECLMCLTEFPHASALGKHYKLVHGRKDGQKMRFQCPKCPKYYAGQVSLKEHLLSAHLNTYRFQCPECQKGYQRRREFNGHIKSHHNTRQQKPVKEDSKNESLSSDTEEHDGAVYECLMCLTEFPHATALGKHYKLVHGRKDGQKMRFQCPKCPKYYAGQGSLKEHWLSAHLNTYKFQCPECQKGFHKRGFLTRHIKSSHKTQQKEVKEDTKSEYVSSGAEEKKQNTLPPPILKGQYSHNRQSLKFDDDTRSSKVACSLPMDIDVEDDDMRTNESEEDENDEEKAKPVFECLMCLTEFTHARALGTHYKSVHGRKEGESMCFQCPKCPKHYVHGESLKGHWLSAHLDYDRFQCPECQKGFHRRRDFKRHIQSHYKTQQQKAVKVVTKNKSLSSEADADSEEGQNILPSPILKGQCSQNRPSLKFDDTRSSKVPCSLPMDIDVEDDDMRINESEEDENNGDKAKPVFECLMCLTEFPHGHALGMHYKLIHGKKEGERMHFQCPKCPKHYLRQESMKQHFLSSHLDYDRFQCPECQKGFIVKGDFKRHIKSHHKTQQNGQIRHKSLSKETEDDDVERKTTLPQSFLKDQRSHNKSSLKLDETGSSKVSSEPGSVMLDMDVDGDDMKINESEEEEENDDKNGPVYDCLMCLTEFPNAHALGKHYKLVHGKKGDKKVRFQCPKCPNHYTGQESLKGHWLSAHLDYDRFQCPECQKGFHRRRDFKRHIKSHLQTQQQKTVEEDTRNKPMSSQADDDVEEGQNILPSTISEGAMQPQQAALKGNKGQVSKSEARQVKAERDKKRHKKNCRK